jgi:hypothetical protein
MDSMGKGKVGMRRKRSKVNESAERASERGVQRTFKREREKLVDGMEGKDRVFLCLYAFAFAESSQADQARAR